MLRGAQDQLTSFQRCSDRPGWRTKQTEPRGNASRAAHSQTLAALAAHMRGIGWLAFKARPGSMDFDGPCAGAPEA